MRKTTRKFIRNLERRLDHYAHLELTHCGHDEFVEQANRYRAKMIAWVAQEVEQLATKAGEL